MRLLLPTLALVVAAGCGRSDSSVRIYTGATVTDGTGASPISNTVIVTESGRISAIGTAGQVDVPRNGTVVDLTGRYVIPGLVNAHAHVGDTRGLETDHYSEANVLDQLARYARYGITTVVSLGDDREEGVRVRDAQAVTSLDRARLFVAGTVVTGDTPDDAIATVEANAAMGVDFIKFRVDDNLGTVAKMPPEIYQPVVARAHELSLPVATHVYYLDDAKDLLRAGIDFVAHSVRDRPVDDELVDLLRTSGVCYCATLMREVSTFVYESDPEFFEDPFFLRDVDRAVVAALRDPDRQAAVRQSRAAQLYKAGLVQAKKNLGSLAAAGVRIAMGTDAGPPGRFQGYFEHLELELMAESGMSNAAVLESATGEAAACMGLNDVGTLEVGKWADFIVLTEDPLEDISNTRTIQDVYVAANRIDRKQD